MKRAIGTAVAVVLTAGAFLGTSAAAHASAASVPTTDTVESVVTELGLSDQLAAWWVTDGVAHVGLTTTTARDAARLKAALGAETVVFQHDEVETASKVTPASAPATRPTVVTHGRKQTATSPASGVHIDSLSPKDAVPFIDYPPYYGADRITSQQYYNGSWWNVDCTVTSNWGGYMLTAGHCSPDGTLWYQGYTNSSGTQVASGELGYSQYHNFGQAAAEPDAMLIWGGGNLDANHIWKSTSSTSTSFQQIGANSPGVGTTVCTDGSTSGYTCGGTVTARNICVNITDHQFGTQKVCNLDEAHNSSAIMSAPGDSGGPVLDSISGGNALVAGVISGETDNGHTVIFSDAAALRTLFGMGPTL
jgi:hypothetical protein